MSGELISIKPREDVAAAADEPIWQAVGATVRGASHVLKGLPNQDAWGMWSGSEAAPILLGVVSDGHGSAKCIRSQAGSQLAVRAAREVVAERAEELMAMGSEAAPDTKALPRALVERWRSLVAQDLLKNPLREDEFERVDAGERERVMVEIVLNPSIAYGATLLLSLLTPTHIICAQLGDGDILFVSDQGVCHRAIEEDPRLIANETTSLCTHQAWRDFRVAAHARDSEMGLVLLSSDGVANAFQTEADFFALGRDLVDELRERSLENIVDDLPIWLDDFSEMGSGDDATLCLLTPLAKPSKSTTPNRPTSQQNTTLAELPPTEPCAPPRPRANVLVRIWRGISQTLSLQKTRANSTSTIEAIHEEHP